MQSSPYQFINGGRRRFAVRLVGAAVVIRALTACGALPPDCREPTTDEEWVARRFVEEHQRFVSNENGGQ